MAVPEHPVVLYTLNEIVPFRTPVKLPRLEMVAVSVAELLYGIDVGETWDVITGVISPCAKGIICAGIITMRIVIGTNTTANILRFKSIEAF